jgi:hypothetical protein
MIYYALTKNNPHLKYNACYDFFFIKRTLSIHEKSTIYMFEAAKRELLYIREELFKHF